MNTAPIPPPTPEPRDAAKVPVISLIGLWRGVVKIARVTILVGLWCGVAVFGSATVADFVIAYGLARGFPAPLSSHDYAGRGFYNLAVAALCLFIIREIRRKRGV